METLAQAWTDEAAGPLVRPYALTNGRTRPTTGKFDLVAFVLAAQPSPPTFPRLYSEHLMVLKLCRQPVTVAELAAQMEHPVDVVRVLLGDLLEARLITVREPAEQTRLPDEELLEAVLNGLKEL